VNGGFRMKLLCKCGNIEDLKTDKAITEFEFKNCNDGTAILVCKKCNKVVIINFKNS